MSLYDIKGIQIQEIQENSEEAKSLPSVHQTLDIFNAPKTPDMEIPDHKLSRDLALSTNQEFQCIHIYLFELGQKINLYGYMEKKPIKTMGLVWEMFYSKQGG